MKYDEFVLENWLNPACDSEKNKYYLGGSCVLPLTIEELFELTGEDMNEFLANLPKMSLAYPYFSGTPKLRALIAEKLYKTVKAEDVVLVTGGTGANSNVVYSLIEPTDNVISIVPNYQQYVSIPEAIGAEVRSVELNVKAGYRLNIDDVRKVIDKNTKAIMFTNPNNPTGSLLTLKEMEELVEIAKEYDAWIVCDEMYRGLMDEWMPSFADMYDKAIITCSSSKVYSMAGLRVGWIICKDPDLRFELFNVRSYNTICGGVFDEELFSIGMKHVDKIFERSRNIVNANKKVIDKWIEDNPYLHQYADAYGTTYLVHYDLDVDATKFCDDLLDKKGVLVCHGNCFNMPYTFRITLSHAHELEKGLSLINEYMDELVAQGVGMHK